MHLVNRIKTAFGSYPMKGHSPQDAARKFGGKQVMEVMGTDYLYLNKNMGSYEVRLYIVWVFIVMFAECFLMHKYGVLWWILPVSVVSALFPMLFIRLPRL